jgi:cyclopropane fatty-acyl-phospholipid synthase-like methyltransferase
VSDPRTKIVGAGYDARVDTWETWSQEVTDDPRHEWSARLAARLSPGARVLELGCGGGTRETHELAARFELVGVDLSERQLERARERVPGATFVHGDLTAIDFEPASFDAVAAFYVFNHVPRELLAPLLGRIRSWLTPGGSLLAAFGTGDQPEWYGDWLGAPTFFSSFPPEINSALVRDAGFAIVDDEVVTIVEPEGPVAFQWILAESP